MQLHYFVSPMCSWCWGFAPVVQQLQETYSAQLSLRIVLTPFRIDTHQAMDTELRNYVLDQWHKVHASTGQTFDFSFAVKNDFIYNTLLACKAIKAFARQCPEGETSFLHAIQKAFYTQNIDITDESNLVEIASNYKIDLSSFTKDMHSKQTEEYLEEDFTFCQQAGVNSYPTLLLQKQANTILLSNGYSPYSALGLELRKQLEESN